jgi:hypothetical protein
MFNEMLYFKPLSRAKLNYPLQIRAFLSVSFNPLALELDVYSSAHHLCKM